ncbi:RNA-guided endonuclease InsQ/TnpB family protein [Microseira wollei]|uniref:Transposase n=1 Tax=Microseira wollei NIES-4236 TaxID=2530354 RepID=A0AAV3XS83_9CYAN|nr:transposase [Microseira wollei]GET44611.1 transposase [Microseira wollei NIES-4236]
MLLCKKIKIIISQTDAQTLEFMQAKCRGLYNWWIGRLRNGEKWKLYEAKKSLHDSKQYDLELNQVYGKLLAEVYFRIDKAMQAFYKRVHEGEKPGFPRFRPSHQFFTLCYPATYLKVEGLQIVLPTGGKGKNKTFYNIVAKLTELPPLTFKEVAVTRDARGNYYCSFVYQKNPAENQSDNTVAFDLGMKTLASGVNEQGKSYSIGGFKGYRWFNRQLDKIRSKRDKCKKGSRRYCYLSNVYKRVSQEKRNKLKDSLHKASCLIAYKLAESAVVIGELSVRQMVIKSDNRKRNRAVFADWGLYPFVEMLKYKCELSGKSLHIISERNTSKTCHRCGHSQDMPLYKRTYKCPSCGLVIDRDANSARNILLRFLARLEPHKLLSVCGVLGVIQVIDTFTHV